MKPWLEHHINSGNIRGLQWLDQQQKIFKLPWKHVGNRDWSATDGAIFKEWEKNKGRYREGVDPIDWPRWKTRFRCALNKLPDIKELRELNRLDTETEEPFKVYQFVTTNNVDCYPFGPDHVAGAAFHDDGTQQSLTLRPPHDDFNLPTTISFDTIDESPRIDSSLGRIDTEDLIKVSMDAYDHHKYNIDIEFEDIVPFKPEVVPQPEETAPQNSNLNRLINISDCTLHIAMNYRGQRVFDRVCTGPEGCHIFYNSCRGDTAHSNVVRQANTMIVRLPDPTWSPTPNTNAHAMTVGILQAMDKGLTLQMKSGSIYAIRRGRCRIYVSTPSWNNGGLLRLDRDVETNIFDVDNYFKPALTKYMHQKGPMPLVEVIISFGQQFSSHESFNDLLIAAKVVHAEAQNLLTIVCSS